MNLKLTSKGFIGVVICSFLFFNQSHAQIASALETFSRYENRKAEGKNVKSYLSYYAQFSWATTSADFVQSYMGTDAYGSPIGEKTINRHYTYNGLNVGAGTYFCLFDVSESSIVAFNLEINANVFQFDPGKIVTSPNSNYDYDISSMQFAVPLSLDLKFGGEAVYDKSQKVSFTVGAGLSPMMNTTGFGESSQLRFAVVPYVHAELGIFAAVEWRIHAAFYTGNSTILKMDPMQTEAAGLNDGSNIMMTQHPVFSIGVAVMPFSFDWKNVW